MIATITIKLTPETQDEAIGTFGREFHELKAATEQVFARDGFCGIPPEKVELRFLAAVGTWGKS